MVAVLVFYLKGLKKMKKSKLYVAMILTNLQYVNQKKIQVDLLFMKTLKI